MSNILTVKDVSLVFNNVKEFDEDGKLVVRDKQILNEVNFQIEEGVKIVALLGISGKGKTQLLRILSGLGICGANLNGSKGKNVTLGGQVLIKKEQQPVVEGDMGIVFQDYYMPDHLKIKAMLVKAAKKNPVFKKNISLINKSIDEILTSFELTEHANKYPQQLSGGQKQRANIAMQLLNGSDFILMDEPFSGLDPIMIDKTTNLLRQVAQSSQNKVLIIVSHDLENCCKICDKIFILSDKGRKPGTGASIIHEINLHNKGISWGPDITRTTAFQDVITEVKNYLV